MERNLEIVKIKLRNAYSEFSDDPNLINDISWAGYKVVCNFAGSATVGNLINMEYQPPNGIYSPTISNQTGFATYVGIEKLEEFLRWLSAMGFYACHLVVFDTWYVNKCLKPYDLDGYETTIFFDEYIKKERL